MDRCVGWHCLTAAQKFGIIFSAAVVTVVLAIAWMYYLGRVATLQRNRKSVALPGGRRIRRNPHIPPTVSLGELPIAQHWPGHPPQVYYQPVIFSTGPPQIAQTVRAQPYFVAGPCQPVRPPPLAYIPTVPCPITSQVGPPAVWLGQQPAQVESPPSPDYQPREPTWAQRLNRAFGLPVGRASTIASRASTDPDRRSIEEPGREVLRVQAVEPTLETNDHPQTQAPTQPTIKREAQGDAASIHTQSTMAATVHSDDYDMIQPSSRPTSAVSGREGPGVGSGQGCKLDVDFYRSLSKSQRPIALSVSSMSD